MFANFSLDKLTNTITTAAQTAQETINTAAQSAQETINNTILSPDVQTKLQIKKTTRFFQEKVGAIPDDEISKLPQDYQQLELKVDALEHVLNRLLTVTKTFELEGYDYPPNISESLNHWWNEDDEEEKETQQEGETDKSKTTDAETGKDNKFTKIVEIDPSILNRSFAIAISKAVLDSQQTLVTLKKREEQGFSKVDSAEEDEDEEEDEDLNHLIRTFQSWSQCYKNIDQSKNDMDTMIVKEFNQKLIDLLEIDFKTVRKLRKRVQESRLEFDTMRHEIKLKNEAKEEEEKAAAAADVAEKVEETKEDDEAKEDETETKKEEVAETTKKAAGKTEEKEENTTPVVAETGEEDEGEESDETEEDKLLEKLEDDFVSNITAAVEKMTEVTDSVEIISLVKLFQNIQLVHYRQCVQELEASMKLLDELPIDTEEA